MATKLVEQLFDDLDGSEISEGGGESIEFSYRGIDYRIDVSSANSAKMDKALRPYVMAAATVRKPSRKANRQAAGAKETTPDDRAAIREWARRNGIAVSGRGRLSAEVIAAFNAAR